MNYDEKMKEFFENEFAAEYIRYSDSMVRYAVTGISAACGVLNEILRENRCDGKSSELTANIDAMCKKLMRMTRLGSVLSDLASVDKESLEVIDSDEFIADFIRSCREVIGSRCEISVSGETGAYFRSSREFLKFFMLISLRSFLSSCESCRELVVSSEVVDKTVEISIMPHNVSDKPVVTEDEFSETLDKFADDIYKLFYEKLGLKCRCEEKKLTFQLPAAKPGGKIVLKSSKADSVGERFSDFGIMLSDTLI